MRARIPQDVDLEDTLVLGLTPMRFAYLVIAALATFSVWSGGWSAVPAVRAAAALPLLAIGAAFAWGGWQGRRLDEWAGDIATFALRRLRARLVRHRRVAAPREAAADDRRPWVCRIRALQVVRRRVGAPRGGAS